MGGEFCVNQLCSLSYYSQKIDRKIEKNKTENIKLRISVSQFLSNQVISISSTLHFWIDFSRVKMEFLVKQIDWQELPK